MILKRQLNYFIVLTCTGLLLASLATKTNTPERFLRQILIPKNGQILRALFTPKDDVRQTIINLINNEQRTIKLACYFFTDLNIANALINAHNRGINTEVIVDPKHLESCEHTKIFNLYRAGIKIYVFNIQSKYGIFHNKFICFGQNLDQNSLLLTGSFNFTSMAQEQNQENVIITNHSEINTSYLDQFEQLKQSSQLLTKFIKKQKLKIT